MDTPVSWLLKATLWSYVAGSFAGLLCLRREKLGNGFAFGLAAVAGGCGVAAAVLFLASGTAAPAGRLALLPSPIPFVQFSARVVFFSAFFFFFGPGPSLG